VCREKAQVFQRELGPPGPIVVENVAAGDAFTFRALNRLLILSRRFEIDFAEALK